MENNNLMNDLDRVVRARHEIANHLMNIAETINKAETEGENVSGKLGLETESEHIGIVSKNLWKGVFRLVVLGDLKRGKSTFLNALIGENLLPSDVNPCTAILTVLRYGAEKKVTVYFTDENPPQELDFKAFKKQYTIDPDEAKKLQAENKLAFPNVDRAVVEYPIPLLEKGIEIVDTPGLNDTEARNKLSLSYINNCHAVFFLFRASQPCTLEERRYLENYIKGRGLTTFFLINAIDEIKRGLPDPDNAEAVAEAENRVRQVFQTYLKEYCQVDGKNIYDERVFEISSLATLRRRIKNPQDSLEGTGFREFLGVFNKYLTQEKAIAGLQQAKTVARQTYNRVREAIERRIPLLVKDAEELKEKISSVEPEFQQLTEIGDRFREEIQVVRDKKAKTVADSLKSYILNLGDNFESDFLRYQPNLGFMESFQQGKREQFQAEFKRAYERYINEKLASWELTAEREISEAFEQLAKSAANYGSTYNQVANLMTEKLIGEKVYAKQNVTKENESPGWASWAMGFFSLAQGNIAGVALAGAGFDWKSVLINYLAVLGISGFLLIFSGGFLLPLGIWAIPLMGMGVGALQVEEGRKHLIKATKKEFVKYLPKLAEEQWQPIYDAVKECFEDYEREVMKRLEDDIKSRRAELNNLVKQKESSEINREAESNRLNSLDADILYECRSIESVYNYLVSSS
ncbi:MAG: dynamin family protein [Cyanobacteriota bacterium]|nr:dynamin family protein [Cyanobacteriota bacterium]